MLISVADLVETVVVGLLFAENITAAIAVVIAKFAGYTVVVDGENMVVGDTFTEDHLMERCATHGAVAREVAPDMLLLLQDSKSRVKLVDAIVKLQDRLQTKMDALRKHDVKIVFPYDLDSLFSPWSVDIDAVAVNDHTTVEHANSRRSSVANSVQGKVVGAGSGNRMRQWTAGTYTKGGGAYKGYRLELTDDSFDIFSPAGENVYSKTFTDYSQVPNIAELGWRHIFSLVQGENPTHPNVCKWWSMPFIAVDVEQAE